MAAEAITIRGLVKNYGKVRALDGLDLSVRTGEVHGFLGPNGSGKSTTMRILLGLLRRDAGTVDLLGGDPYHDAVALHRRIAYVPGDVNLWPDLTGGEAIEVLGKLRGGYDRKRRDDLLERFDLDPTKKGRTYSKGNRQKVAIVAALTSDAELFLFDEPTSGLDPLMELVFQDCVAELKANGRTALLSSHILSEVEALCDRMSIIRHGRIVQTGTLSDLRHLSRTKIVAETTTPADGIAELPGVTKVHQLNGHIEFSVDPDHLGDTIARLSTFDIQTLTSTPPSLEELFLRHYGNQDVPEEMREGRRP